MNDTHGGQAETGCLENKQRSHFVEKLKLLFTASKEEL